MERCARCGKYSYVNWCESCLKFFEWSQKDIDAWVMPVKNFKKLEEMLVDEQVNFEER